MGWSNRKLLVTIDTETDADIHWRKRLPRAYSSVTEGIPKYYRPIWDAYKINPIYFVSPEVLENEPACRVLRDEIGKGAIIGAHLHPDFIEPEATPPWAEAMEKFPCFGYRYEIEKAKIVNLKEKIRKCLGVTAVWYRAARFGADGDTIKILAELGFKHDSSFTPGINWQAKGGPDHGAVPVGAHKLEPYDVWEHPVTIAGKRCGMLGRVLPNHWLFYRWLRPTHMTYLEQKSLILEMCRKGVEELVMMFHSMEVMVDKTPYVRSAAMQRYFLWRLRKTLAFVTELGYQSWDGERG